MAFIYEVDFIAICQRSFFRLIFGRSRRAVNMNAFEESLVFNTKVRNGGCIALGRIGEHQGAFDGHLRGHAESEVALAALCHDSVFCADPRRMRKRVEGEIAA
jgi:hypothetical protein